jgi:hypothetical protein
MSSFDEATIVARADNKVAAEIGDEAVILDISSGFYFQLNLTGARIWALIEEPMPFGALCATLEEAFAGDPREFRADIAEFLGLMRDKGLVEIRAA